MQLLQCRGECGGTGRWFGWEQVGALLFRAAWKEQRTAGWKRLRLQWVRGRPAHRPAVPGFLAPHPSLHLSPVLPRPLPLQRLAELRVVHDGLRVPVGLEALQKTLRDKAVFYRWGRGGGRCEGCARVGWGGPRA